MNRKAIPNRAVVLGLILGLALLCALAGALGSAALPEPAYAVTAAEKQAEADQAAREAQEAQAKADEAGKKAEVKQAEADKISENIDALQTKLSKAQKEYDTSRAKYKKAKAAADEAKARSEAAQAKISETQVRLSSRAVEMYKSGGSITFLEVFLGVSTFEEFLTTWDAMETIADQDADLIQENKDAKAEADAAAEEYGQQTEIAEKEMNKAKAAKQEVESTKASLESELSKVNEQVATLLAQEEEAQMEAEEAEQRMRDAEEAAARLSNIGGGGDGGGGGTTRDVGSMVAGWKHPCPGYYGVTNEFGWAGAWDGCFHNGIDLGASSGTPIHSIGNGTVTYVGWYGSGGQAVIVSHGNGVQSIYMHMSKFGCSQGQCVSAGDTIGYVGSTGYSTGPHLHFQIEVDGTPVNPRKYFSL